MHCCWTLCFIRLVIAILVCTSVVCAASFLNRQDEVQLLSPSPSPVSGLTPRADNLGRRAKPSKKLTVAESQTKPMAKKKVASSGGASSDALSQLFPVKGSGPKWTTLDGASGALPLSDATLRPQHAAKGVQHSYVKYDGKSCLKSHYPAGSWNLKGSPKGGISFYAPGPANVNLETAHEAIFSYSVLFPVGFNFVKGGKLPGLCMFTFVI